MAPISYSIYFPPLEKCLDGEELLISWKSAFSAISSSAELGTDHKVAIQKFLEDPDVLNLLSNPFEAYPAPSSQTKATFETRTSAINATPSSTAQYDIKEVKEDALWLSKTAQIDEVSALRITVEECQSRATAQLQGPFSEEELASIREAAGESKYSSPIPVSLLSQGVDAEAIKKEFDNQHSRRERILQTYLSERRNFLKCGEHLLHACFSNPESLAENGKGKGPQVAPSWIIERGRALASQLELNGGDKFSLRCIKFIDTKIKSIENGSGWFSEDGGRENVEIAWIQTQIVEATHSMEILWHFLVYVIGFPSSQVALGWFRLQQSFGFFNTFSMEEPSVQALVLPMQAISTVISVAMIDLADCLDLLGNLRLEEQVSPNVPADRPFFLNSQTILDIHNIICEAADRGFTTAGPAIFAWSVILQSMSERVGEFQEASRFDRQSSHDTELTLAPDVYSNVMEQIMDNSQEDLIDFLARMAVNSCGLFETISALSLRLGSTSDSFFSNSVGSQMRMILLDVIKSSTRIGYIPEIVEATLSTLNAGQSYWDILDSKPLLRIDDPVVAFLDDELLVQQVLVNAKSRYPCEPLPFLKMIRSIAASPYCFGDEESLSATKILENLSVFTYVLPLDFADYETTQEEDNNNNIRLTRDIQLFESRSRAVRYQAPRNSSMALATFDPDFCIRAGTLGRIVSESGPRVAFWFHQFSGLKYIGKLLETFLAASDQVDGTTGMPAEPDSVSEIIEILASLLLSINISSDKSSQAREEAEHILKEASSGLSRNRDIATVIFDIFEEELQNKSSYSGPDVSLDILVSCVHFMHAMVPLFPGLVWPFMSRTGLLGVGGGRLSTIVESVELISGRYELLISCCRLYESLVDDYAANAIHRKRSDKSTARFKGGEDLATGIPNQVLSKVLLSFTRYLMDVLESSRDWKYVSHDDRRRLSRAIGTTFDKLLQYAFGLDSPLEPTSLDDGISEQTSFLKPPSKKKKEKLVKLMEPLMLSASHIVESFLASSSGQSRFQPFLRAYFDGLETPETTTFTTQLRLWTAQVNSILLLSKTLLQVSTLLQRPTSNFEGQLFKASSLVARLYASNDTYRNSIVTLFESLLVTASNSTPEPPSLLGHLGPRTAKNFLHILADLDKPLSRDRNVSQIWHFLAIVVSSRQQWFANYLLTGKTPRDALKTKTTGKELVALDRTLLTTALSKLSHIDKLTGSEALAMLEFVALAQNFWPWTVCDSPRYAQFIKAISDHVGKLKPLQQASNLKDALYSCHQTRVAAYIAEIFAMHMFHSRQTGTDSHVKDIVDNLDYFERFGVAPPKNKGYNGSLHSLLKINFEARYPGSTLRDLKRTTLDHRQLGNEYFYNLSLAEKMLGGDEAWTGRKNDGLRTEIENANVNLSLVDAQIALFNSWRFLAIELSGSTLSNTELQKKFAQVVLNCLQENQQSQPPEEIFSRLSQIRIDFALVLTQRLIQAKSSAVNGRALLSEVWKTICSLREKFEQSVRGEDVLYYRSLLKLLFLAVRANAEAKPASETEDLRASRRGPVQSSDIIPTVLDILKYVVSMGLRETASSIHDTPADSSPEDLSLITGILQSCLRIPGIELYHQQIVSLMLDNRTADMAVSLFSFSDSLAIDGDPIYGELSILFLLELSSMPLMAEQLAIKGTLSNIASANITTYLRRGGVSPFADSTGLQRCYSIWARGILPLLLNLLDAVQTSIAVEVALFLAQFEVLLTQNQQAFDAPETNRIIPKGQTKYITLTICSETHSMSLLSFILGEFREILKGTVEIPEVKWDAAGVLENVEFWLSSKALLRERLLPMGEREVEMVRRKPAGDAVSDLERKVTKEMIGIRDVLSSKESM